MKIINRIRRGLEKEIKKIMINEFIIIITINKNLNICHIIININMKFNLNKNMTKKDNEILF